MSAERQLDGDEWERLREQPYERPERTAITYHKWQKQQHPVKVAHRTAKEARRKANGHRSS